MLTRYLLRFKPINDAAAPSTPMAANGRDGSPVLAVGPLPDVVSLVVVVVPPPDDVVVVVVPPPDDVVVVPSPDVVVVVPVPDDVVPSPVVVVVVAFHCAYSVRSVAGVRPAPSL